uniref:Uncharacterized protein n=1 Tax=Hyaloperonospora arabidopsidis (strain Emoy2) TaxID=559515 RepID=M4BDQ4_HYAAE
MTDDLCRELQQLSTVQLQDLLSASGHGNLLRGDEREKDEKVETRADEQLVMDVKNEGNALFRQGLMVDAISAYTRSLHMKQFDHAITDCSKAIEVAPTIKSFMRRATAYIVLQQFVEGITDIEAALQFEPCNKECYTKLQSIVDTATDVSQHAASATLRRAAVRAAAIVSVRKGWKKHAVRGNPGPAAVNGHTLFQGTDERVYLFGGRAVRDQKPNVYVLDENDNSSWEVVPIRGTIAPSSRAWHTTTPIGYRNREFYCVYGGVSSRGEDSRVYLLDSDLRRGFRWLQPRCLQHSDEEPTSRSGHTAISIVEESGHRVVYIFGGRTKQGVTNQLLVLRCCSQLDVPPVGTDGVVDPTIIWDEICPHPCGDWPLARDGHSMCLLQSSKYHSPRLIVFGGNGQLNDEKMNDVWMFDMEEQLWTLLECVGDVPQPRSYHTAHTVGEFMFVVGGRTAESEDSSLYMLDVGTCEWVKASVPSNHTLAPRAWHSSVLTDGGKLFVLGGGTYIGPLKDAAMLDLGYFKTKAPLLRHP